MHWMNDFIKFGEWILTYLQIVSCEIFESSPPPPAHNRWGPWRGAKGASPKPLWCNRFGVKKNPKTHPNPPVGLGLSLPRFGLVPWELFGPLPQLRAIMWMSNKSIEKERKHATWKLLEHLKPEQCGTGMCFLVSSWDVMTPETTSLFHGWENVPFLTENGKADGFQKVNQDESRWQIVQIYTNLGSFLKGPRTQIHGHLLSRCCKLHAQTIYLAYWRKCTIDLWARFCPQTFQTEMVL